MGKALFEDADLKINMGQRYGLHGPNGKGKTSNYLHNIFTSNQKYFLASGAGPYNNNFH